MTQSRAEQVSIESTAFYHCISRCVRRAFLCGDDDYSGKNFDHRKEWVEDRLLALLSIFAIDVCAYAVMSNHFHLVLRIDRELAESWTEDEVAERYGKLFRGAANALEGLGVRQRNKTVELWRERLWSLSWMMRSLNEFIARKANKEDACKGRFWEGRFKSQPLLDEEAVLTCMAYVDLNPVRAGLCTGLDDAEFTSIGARLAQAESAMKQTQTGSATKNKKRSKGRARKTKVRKPNAHLLVPAGLAPFADQASANSDEHVIPMQFVDYIELLEWTGRCARAIGPAGRIRGQAPALLTRLRLNPAHWLRTMEHQGLQTLGVLGSLEALDDYAQARGKSWVQGKGWAKQLYGASAPAPAPAPVVEPSSPADGLNKSKPRQPRQVRTSS